MIQTNNLAPNNWSNQQQMQVAQPFGRAMLPGKMISSVSDILPQDVPMDGSPAFFPQNDGSCVYIKFFDKSCNIQTVRYVLDPEQVKMIEKPKDPIQAIMDRLESIEKRLDQDKPKSDAKSYYGSKEE